FSSRRRHTSFSRDWSSDVCSSDLKAKTIEKFLGKDFIVESSFGHIADLPSKELGVDVDGDFKPKYEVSKDKKAVVKKLKDLAKSDRKSVEEGKKLELRRRQQ